MARLDRSKSNDIRSELNRTAPSEDKPTIKNKTLSAKDKFLLKIEEGLWNDFTKSDWLMYFQKKYKDTNGFGYSVVGNPQFIKHYSVINSLMKNYSPQDIKDMIDFLFDSSQDLQDKRRLTIYFLSGGFLTGVYQDTQLWVMGEYLNKREQWAKEKEEANKKAKAPTRRREWTKDTEKSEDRVANKRTTTKKTPLKKKKTSSASKISF